MQTKAATGSNRKALIGAYVTIWSSNAYGEIGAYYDAIGKQLSASQVAAKIALHGMVGGISALAQGGNFGHGFASAGVTQGLSPLIKRLGHTTISRVFIVAIIGGIVSRVSGGKFANGAVTGAFSRLFNDEGHLDKLFGENEKAIQSIKLRMEQTMGPDGVTIIEKSEMAAILSYETENMRVKWDDFGILPMKFIDEYLHNEADSNLIDGTFADSKFIVNGYENRVFKGSDINYIVVGIVVAHTYNTTPYPLYKFKYNKLTMHGAILKYNMDQVNAGISVEHNRKQALDTAQYWGGVGYDFYNSYK